jgi:hypothetical protein
MRSGSEEDVDVDVEDARDLAREASVGFGMAAQHSEPQF